MLLQEWFAAEYFNSKDSSAQLAVLIFESHLKDKHDRNKWSKEEKQKENEEEEESKEVSRSGRLEVSSGSLSSELSLCEAFKLTV